MNKKENIKAYIAWIAICIIWGTTYLAIRIGVEDLPPLLFAGLRWLIAGPILFSILKMKKFALPKREDIIPLAIIGLALLGIGNGLVVFAEQWVPSGLTALLITTVPFWMVGLESISQKEFKFNSIIILGLLLGFLGVGLIFGSDIDKLFDPSYLGGIIGLMIAEFGWSAGSIYSKYKKINLHPLMSASIQMTIAGLVMTLIGLLLGEGSNFYFTDESFGAFIYLVVIGSLIGYASYIYAIAHLPISLVSTYAYINPIIALILGWLILDEEFSTIIIVAAVIILIGVGAVKKGSERLIKNSK